MTECKPCLHTSPTHSLPASSAPHLLGSPASDSLLNMAGHTDTGGTKASGSRLNFPREARPTIIVRTKVVRPLRQGPGSGRGIQSESSQRVKWAPPQSRRELPSGPWARCPSDKLEYTRDTVGLSKQNKTTNSRSHDKLDHGAWFMLRRVCDSLHLEELATNDS